MYCQKCGKESEETSLYCTNCGYKLKNDIEYIGSIKTEAINKNISPYNKWARAISVIWGALILLGSIGSGIPYYFESGLPQVLFCEIFIIPISITLILLGLFPEYVNNKIQIKDKYTEIIVGIIIISFIISAIQPEPPQTWWNYNPKL